MQNILKQFKAACDKAGHVPGQSAKQLQARSPAAAADLARFIELNRPALSHAIANRIK